MPRKIILVKSEIATTDDGKHCGDKCSHSYYNPSDSKCLLFSRKLSGGALLRRCKPCLQAEEFISAIKAGCSVKFYINNFN